MSFVNQYRSTTVFGELKVQKFNSGNIAGLLDVSGNALFRGDVGVNGNLYATDGTVDVSGNLTVSGTITGNVTGTATTATNVTATAVSTDANFSVPFLSAATGSAAIRSDSGITYNPSTNTLLTDVYGFNYSSNPTKSNTKLGYSEGTGNSSITSITTTVQTLITSSTLPVGVYIFFFNGQFNAANPTAGGSVGVDSLFLTVTQRVGTATRKRVVNKVAANYDISVCFGGTFTMTSSTTISIRAQTSVGTITALTGDTDDTHLEIVRVG